MPKQTHTATIPSPYDEAAKRLSQAQALNLALWTSSDVHEQIKPACWLMAELLSSIADDVDNILNNGSGGNQ